jgi:hypothetical protein
MKRYIHLFIILIFITGISIQGCFTKKRRIATYPEYITPNKDYYVTRIGSVPKIDETAYRLSVTGLVKKPRSFTLEELRKLDMVEVTLTVECIGNAPDGPLLSTATWKGFRLYDLLVSLGLDKRATGVQYHAADGYFASHTLKQIKENKVIGALYMNGEVIPPKHGFPLRFLNPGYHGVKQPAWVTQIKVLDKPVKDYWEERGWDCSPPMAIDSTIFFPEDGVQVKAGKPLALGGSAFGGTRVKKVEITTDGGKTWRDAQIVKSMDANNVWVFWKATITFPKPGEYTINVRATDIRGRTQQEDDPDKYDGVNDWPVLRVEVTE